MTNYIGPAPVPQAVQRRETFTATAGQTSFATAGYTVGYIDVYLNGVHLVDGTDYTATNGSDVVLTTGAADGDTLETVAFTPFQAVDQAFTGNTSAENLTATTADINGGTIDGTVIGGTTPAAGSFTSGDFSTGVYLGGTASANLLDDYETGTWTPSIVATGTNPTVSYTARSGNYVKVGSSVTIHVYMLLSAFSGGSGGVQLGSLPFTPSATRCSGSLSYSSGFPTAPQACLTSSSSPSASLYYFSGSSVIGIPTTDLNGNEQFRLSLTYEV